MWEVCRRCISNGVAQDYAAPYSDYFPNPTHEPSIDEIRKLICLDQRRPEIHNRWSSDPVSCFFFVFKKRIFLLNCNLFISFFFFFNL